MVAWLLKLGAKVVGVSRDIPTDPSMFKVLELDKKIEHHLADVRDIETLTLIIERTKPDFVFHLAAQAMTDILDIGFLISPPSRKPIST